MASGSQIPPFPSGSELWASVLSPLNRVGQDALVPEVRFVAFLLDRFLAPLGQPGVPEPGGDPPAPGSAQLVDVWSVAVLPTVHCPDLFFGGSPWRWPGHSSSSTERPRRSMQRTHDDRDHEAKSR